MSYSSADKFAKARRVHRKYIDSLSVEELIRHVQRLE